MPEIRRTAIPVEVHYICDECNEGHMINQSGTVLTTFPPKYTLTCLNCGAKMLSAMNYPVIEYIYQTINKEEE